MKFIEDDINKVYGVVYEGFEEPLKDCGLKNFLSDNSKKIRIILPILYFKALGLELNKNVYLVLATGELLHNASLLHDDVIDDAEKRRGQTTIGKLFSDKISILCGDYLLALSVKNIMKLNNPDVSDIFEKCTEKMSFSEIHQYFLRDNDIDLDEYISICKGKTASLFSAIFESCAKILNSNSEKAFTFGENFGILFQLKNDMDKSGSILDKKNKIHTIIDILGIENANILSDNYKQELFEMLSEIPENIYKNKLKDLISNL